MPQLSAVSNRVRRRPVSSFNDGQPIGGNPVAASAVSVSSATLSGTGTDAQAVFEELDNLLDDHSARHENGGADEISISGLDGVPVELLAHLVDPTDAHDASAISVADAGGHFAATDVEGVLAELFSDIGAGSGITEATIASPIPATPAGQLQATPDSPYQLVADGSNVNYHGPIFKMKPPVNGDYSWINQGSSTVSTTNGGVHLASPANAADSWSFRVKTCPATPYTLTAYVMPLMINVNFSGVALVLRKASDGTWIGFQQYCVSPDLYLSVGHGTNTGPAITVDDLGSVIIPQFYPWMRISDDATNRKFWVSMDGNNWLQVYTQAHATPLVPDQIGFGVESRNATYGIGLTVLSWLEA